MIINKKNIAYIITILLISILPVVKLVLKVGDKSNDKDFLVVLTEIKDHYDADRVTAYQFFKMGDVPKPFDNLDYTHIKCYTEVITDSTAVRCHNFNEVPIAWYNTIYIDAFKGVYSAHITDSILDTNIRLKMESLGAKSWYYLLLRNTKGKPVGFIALKYEKKVTKVEDFEYLEDKINNEIADLVGNW